MWFEELHLLILNVKKPGVGTRSLGYISGSGAYACPSDVEFPANELVAYFYPPARLVNTPCSAAMLPFEALHTTFSIALCSSSVAVSMSVGYPNRAL